MRGTSRRWPAKGLSGAMIEEMMAATERESGDRAGRVRALFDRFAGTAGAVIANSAETALKTEGADPVLREHRRAGGGYRRPAARACTTWRWCRIPEADEDVSSSDALHAVLFDSGRPVLIAPRDVPETIGTRVCFAWNGTAESAAAVAAALPWLHRANAVQLLHADEYQRRGPKVEGIRAYLRWHEIEAEPALFKPMTKDVGAGLLGAARDFQRRPALHGRLQPFPAAPADPRRRDPARAGEQRHAGADVPLTR